MRVPTHLPPPPPIKGKVKSNITYSSHKQIKILNTHALVKKDITARLKKGQKIVVLKRLNIVEAVRVKIKTYKRLTLLIVFFTFL